MFQVANPSIIQQTDGEAKPEPAKPFRYLGILIVLFIALFIIMWTTNLSLQARSFEDRLRQSEDELQAIESAIQQQNDLPNRANTLTDQANEMHNNAAGIVIRPGGPAGEPGREGRDGGAGPKGPTGVAGQRGLFWNPDTFDSRKFHAFTALETVYGPFQLNGNQFQADLRTANIPSSAKIVRLSAFVGLKDAYDSSAASPGVIQKITISSKAQSKVNKRIVHYFVSNEVTTQKTMDPALTYQSEQLYMPYDSASPQVTIETPTLAAGTGTIHIYVTGYLTS
jgi:hypothetical protein